MKEKIVIKMSFTILQILLFWVFGWEVSLMVVLCFSWNKGTH